MTFNLIDEPWIPVSIAGSSAMVGLADAFERSRQIASIGGEAPPVQVALHRLLFAVFMAAVGRDSSQWNEWWERGSGPTEEVLAYLETRRGRFDLLDAEAPFYQAASLDAIAKQFPLGHPKAKVKGVALLVPSLASGNNKTLFDHATPARKAALRLDEAARWLVTLQAYDLGGTKTGAGSGPGYAKIAPLCGAAHVTPVGATLAKTILLNSIAKRNWELDARNEDAPAWDRPPPGIDPEARDPDGTLDWLTWQSRRVRLFTSGATVDRVMITPGDHPATRQRWECEPYVPFRKSDHKKGDTYNPVRLSTTRQAWRDLYSIVATTDEQLGATVVEQLAHRLDTEGGLLTIEVAGTVTDMTHQNILDWRSDRFEVPLMIAVDERARETLQVAIELATDVARDVRRGVRTSVTTETSGKEGDGWAEECVQVYWAALASRFPNLLHGLGQGTVDDASHAWQQDVRTAVKAAMRPVEMAGAAPGNWERWSRGFAFAASRKPYLAYEDAMHGVLAIPATEEVNR